MIDARLFLDILGFESTSGKERPLSEFLARRLEAPGLEHWELEDGTQNLLFSWGTPRLVFCTHMDTVPPYIAPRMEGERVWGRGSCDAKGQIMTIYSACRKLVSEGLDGFGMLLLSGEETGSWGAKAFAKLPFRAPYLVVCEPTESKMVSASKGTKGFKVRFDGRPFHSGYPQYGYSAVDAFVDFVQALRDVSFQDDPLLGPTTWNIGRLASDNAQNVLSPCLECRVYFRTTCTTDALVAGLLPEWAQGSLPWQQAMSVEAVGGDAPARYMTLPDIESGPVAFGSDAPHLSNFEHKMIFGPGSIRTAHRDDEHIDLSEMEEAADTLVAIAKALL